MQSLPRTSARVNARPQRIGETVEEVRKAEREKCLKEKARANESMKMVRKYIAIFLAEFLGLFALVFIGAGATDLAILAGLGGLHPYLVGVAFTAALFPLILTFAPMGSGHFNAGITIVSAVTDKKFMSAGVGGVIVRSLIMLIGQFLGSLLGAVFLRFVIGGGSIINACTVPSVGDGITILVESLWVTLILLVVLVCKSSPNKALAIAVFVGIAVAQHAGITGGSFNAMRSIGPGIVEGQYTGIGFYFLTNLVIGPIVAILLYWALFNMPPESKPTKMGTVVTSKRHLE